MAISTGSAPATLMAPAPSPASVPLTNQFDGTPKVAYAPIDKKEPAFKKKSKKAF